MQAKRSEGLRSRPVQGPRPGAGAALAFLVAALAAGGCAQFDEQAVATPPPAQGGSAAAAYVIGVPDLLRLTVWEQPDLSGELLVRRDGVVSVPLLGEVRAEGLTPMALAERIETGLSRYVATPQVDVAVVEMRSQVVSVIGGGVQRSGVVELRHQMRVVDALAEMGGLTEFARRRDIRVLRQTDDGEVTYAFDYQAFEEGRAPRSNFLLQPGDTIIVPD